MKIKKKTKRFSCTRPLVGSIDQAIKTRLAVLKEITMSETFHTRLVIIIDSLIIDR